MQTAPGDSDISPVGARGKGSRRVASPWIYERDCAKSVLFDLHTAHRVRMTYAPETTRLCR